MVFYLTHSGLFHRSVVHARENIGFLRVLMFLKLPLYGQILIELVES